MNLGVPKSIAAILSVYQNSLGKNDFRHKSIWVKVFGQKTGRKIIV